MAKAKATKSTTKGTTKTKATKKPVVPDRLPPATQAEIIAVEPDKGVDRIPVLEPTANTPYLTPEQLTKKATGPEAKALAKQNAEREKAAKQQSDAQISAAAARKKAADDEYKDRENRGVQVQALRKGFYPHDGRLRNPGEIFTYHLHRDPKTKKVEDSLPTWLQDIDGKIPTRESDELSAHDERVFQASGAQPTPFVGATPAATGRAGGSSVI